MIRNKVWYYNLYVHATWASLNEVTGDPLPWWKKLARRVLPRPNMELFDALSLLARVHTREDWKVGFVVEMGAAPMYNYDMRRYVEAWEVVRDAVRLPVTVEQLNG